MKPMPQAPELATHFFIFNALHNYHRFWVSALYRDWETQGKDLLSDPVSAVLLADH